MGHRVRIFFNHFFCFFTPTASFARVGLMGPARDVKARVRSGFMLAMSNVKGVARNEDLLNVVQLAKRAMPNRPDGVVVCAQNSSLQHIRNTLATVFT